MLFDVQRIVPVTAVHDVGVWRETFRDEGKFELLSVHPMIIDQHFIS
ncbi:hypothetical protein [Pseudarthrobacter sp. NPDC080039]